MANVARAGRRQILLKGRPNQSEEGVAGAAIKPGYLVDGVNTILPHASAGGVAPKCFAAERDEMGLGVDDTYSNSSFGPTTVDYQIGDTVKVLACAPGDRVCAWISSGQNITANDRMESAGDGTLRKYAAGTILARALEAYDARNVVGPILIKVEVM